MKQSCGPSFRGGPSMEGVTMFERIVNLCPQTHRSPHRLSEVPEGPQPSSVARRCPRPTLIHACTGGRHLGFQSRELHGTRCGFCGLRTSQSAFEVRYLQETGGRGDRADNYACQTCLKRLALPFARPTCVAQDDVGVRRLQISSPMC